MRSQGIVPSCNRVFIVPSDIPSVRAASLRVRKEALGVSAGCVTCRSSRTLLKYLLKSRSRSASTSCRGTTARAGGCMDGGIDQKRHGCNIPVLWALVHGVFGGKGASR